MGRLATFLLPVKQPTPPVCLLIDEAQNVRGSPDRKDKNELLLHLHASNYPSLLVFGGLGNTLSTLEQAKLSRTAVGNARNQGRELIAEA